MTDIKIILKPERMSPEVLEQRYREAGLLKRNITADWTLIEKSGSEAAKKVMARLRNDSKTWITLFGPTGTHKSAILSCMAKDAVCAGRSVVFGTAKELIDKINETNIDQRGEFRKELKKCSLLVIDEVGRNSSSEAFKNTLFDIVQHRERDELQTAFATNMNETVFWTEYLDDAFQRRCEEQGAIVNFKNGGVK